MRSDDSITCWIGKLKAGDHSAAEKLWGRYFPRLVALARKKLPGTIRAASDEEDVALSVLEDLFRGAESGQFSQLTNRDDLWGLLVAITCRKAINLICHERRQKRGGGHIKVHLGSVDKTDDDVSLDQVLSSEPSPYFLAQVSDQCQCFLDKLDNADLRAVAEWKIEGYSNEEIAKHLGCTTRTIERKLRSIRTIWLKEGLK